MSNSYTISFMSFSLEDEVPTFISTEVHGKPIYFQKSNLHTKIHD